MLELRALCKQWVAPAGTTVPLLQGVDLQVRRAETVAILGPSGSGKSTLLKIVAGLEPADSGSVYWDGTDLDGVPPERRHFALLFQDFALFPHLSVVDNVAFGLVEQGQRRGAARAQATAVLARFGLEARVADRVTQLSGGEQQRVALARALVTQPRVLLLDEPFSALDAVLRQRLRDEFRQRIAQGGMAALLVTHDESEAQAMAQRTFRLEAGRLVAVGA